MLNQAPETIAEAGSLIIHRPRWFFPFQDPRVGEDGTFRTPKRFLASKNLDNEHRGREDIHWLERLVCERRSRGTPRSAVARWITISLKREQAAVHQPHTAGSVDQDV